MSIKAFRASMLLLSLGVSVSSCRPNHEDRRSGGDQLSVDDKPQVTSDGPAAAVDQPGTGAPKKDDAGQTPGGEVEADNEPRTTGDDALTEDRAIDKNDFSLLPEKAPDGAADSVQIDAEEVVAKGLGLTTTLPTDIILDKLGRDGNRYVMQRNGDFFRYIAKQNNLKCQITTNVKDFKISMHETDAAILYYIRLEATKNNLYVLHPLDASATGNNCPRTSAVKIMDSIKIVSSKFRYTVVSNTSAAVKTNIVNMALSTSDGGVADRLRAWNATSAVYTQSGVKDYIMNECWAVETKHFNNFVAFAQTNSNQIFKISGVDPIGATKPDPQTWTSFTAFKDNYNVCSLINPPPPPPATTKVEFFRSDYCSASLLGTIDFTGTASSDDPKCAAFAAANGTSSVWGVKINGKCYDIHDTPAADACKRYQNDPDKADTVHMYRSDYCSGSALAFLKYPTTPAAIDALCAKVTTGSTLSVWGLKVGTGGCLDVQDVSLVSGCQRFRNMAVVPTGTQRAVNFYRSDYCNGSFLTRMVFDGNATANNAACASMAGQVAESVWGVQRGTSACENIADQGFTSACSNFR